jgi:purine-binding chemotaxis protein CheW
MNQVYLSFNIGNELFAINVQKVLEVLQKQTITPVPNSPEFITGIINFRGEVVPVFDTRIKFNLHSHSENDSFAIVVLDLIKNNEPFRIGATVDRVRDVITINTEDIKPVPPMSSSFNTEFLSGIVRLNDQFILLIDVDKVFSQNEIQTISDVSESSISNGEKAQE